MRFLSRCPFIQNVHKRPSPIRFHFHAAYTGFINVESESAIDLVLKKEFSYFTINHLAPPPSKKQTNKKQNKKTTTTNKQTKNNKKH